MFKYPFDDLFNPLLQAMHNLGGSATIEEMVDEVAKVINLSEADAAVIHKGEQTKFEYNLAWARTYLKKYGLLQNSERAVWVLTPKGRETRKIDKKAVKQYCRELYIQSRNSRDTGKKKASDIDSEIGEELELEFDWKFKLIEKLKAMQPSAFERLTKLLLRELGFVNVEVTGTTGDGGIDGKGIVKINGVLSFHVAFQCKRYKEVVSPSLIREFRGTLSQHFDKGLFVTTGRFTREAEKEAMAEGKVAIDLIDGNEFAERLKALKLGVIVHQRIVEDVTIDEKYFDSI